MRYLSSQRVVLTSFIVDISDVVLNIVIALLSGSVVMLSQALQGVADLLTSGLLLVGIKQSHRRADKRHHFGYGREIYFWTFMSGISMFLITSVASFYVGLQRYLHPEPITNLTLAFLVLTLGFITNSYAFWLSWQRLHGNHPNQPIAKTFIFSDLIETKATFILDLMGSVAAILGIAALGIFALTGDSRFDGIGAMVVGVVTAVFSIFLMFEVKDLLVGRSASPEHEIKIRQTTEKMKGITKILDLRTMYIGSGQLLVNMEVHVDEEKTTDELEALIDKIKARVKHEVPSVRHIQVELETPANEL